MTVRAAAAVAVLLFATVAEAAGIPPPGCVGTTWTRTWSRIDADLDPATLQTTAVYFTVQAPCYVTFDSDFVITAKIVDERCPMDTLVGAHWNITDTDMTTNVTSTIAGAGVNGVSGFAGMRLTVPGVDPTWVATVKQHYGPTGTPANHRIGFRFLARADSGCYLTGMNWDTQIIGTTVYDPYPDTTTVDPAPPASTDPGGSATVDPGGSGTVDPGAPASTEGGGANGGTGGGTGGTGGTSGTAPGATAPAAETGGCGSSGVTPALLGLAALAAAGFPRRRRAR